MIEKERITAQLQELEESTKDWQRYQQITLEELQTNRDKQHMVLHTLLTTTQSIIDISNHIIAAYRLPKPSTYREIFKILTEANIIPPEMGNQLSQLAGLRNVLVHIYWKLNIEEIHGVLKNDLTTIEQFKIIIKKLLQENEHH